MQHILIQKWMNLWTEVAPLTEESQRLVKGDANLSPKRMLCCDFLCHWEPSQASIAQVMTVHALYLVSRTQF